jgi:methylthioribose-1-phosphate isomerase
MGPFGSDRVPGSLPGDLRPEEIVRLEQGRVVVLDQRRLPGEVSELSCMSAQEVAEAIRSLAVRGAPAIGVAAAMGYALAASRGEDLEAATATLLASRPTAVNLPWAIAEMRAAGSDPAVLAARARELHLREVERCIAMGEAALELFSAGSRPLTHCNTGALATAGHGSALGAIRTAHHQGLIDHVFVDETRPLYQGARLTAWELERAGIPGTVIVDGAAGALMRAGEITHVLVGADRIARNGDVANKIGTYALAVLADHHEIPFVVVAPTSTLDASAVSGAAIPVEERSPSEISGRFAARNPAFDVTPAELVTAIVTEEGVHRPPYQFHATTSVGAGLGPPGPDRSGPSTTGSGANREVAP